MEVKSIHHLHTFCGTHFIICKSFQETQHITCFQTGLPEPLNKFQGEKLKPVLKKFSQDVTTSAVNFLM